MVSYLKNFIKIIIGREKKSWEPFGTCLISSTGNLAHFHPDWAELAVTFSRQIPSRLLRSLFALAEIFLFIFGDPCSHIFVTYHQLYLVCFGIKVEIILEQRQVAYLSPFKICENLNFSTQFKFWQIQLGDKNVISFCSTLREISRKLKGIKGQNLIFIHACIYFKKSQITDQLSLIMINQPCLQNWGRGSSLGVLLFPRVPNLPPSQVRTFESDHHHGTQIL